MNVITKLNLKQTSVNEIKMNLIKIKTALCLHISSTAVKVKLVNTVASLRSKVKSLIMIFRHKNYLKRIHLIRVLSLVFVKHVWLNSQNILLSTVTVVSLSLWSSGTTVRNSEKYKI